jgi:hypothetical protein
MLKPNISTKAGTIITPPPIPTRPLMYPATIPSIKRPATTKYPFIFEVFLGNYDESTPQIARN